MAFYPRISLCCSAFRRCSDLRQIPDTQEVFLSPDSDTSLVVEILEHVQPPPTTEIPEGEAIARLHFDALAHDNAAESQAVIEVVAAGESSFGAREYASDPQSLRSLPTPAPNTLLGTQRVRKFNSQQADEVLVRVAVWRVDLVRRGNGSAASTTASAGSEAQGDTLGRRRADVVASVNVNLSAPAGQAGTAKEEAERVAEWFQRAVAGMRIADYGLFEEVEAQSAESS